MDNHFEHGTAHVVLLEQDGFLIKIHAQVPSDSGVSGRELLSRVEQISGHLRRVKCCESISRGQLAFARIEDVFHRVRALGDNVEGRVAVKFIDYGHEDVLLLSDIIVVDPPLSDVLTTVRPLAEEFYVDGILLMRPLSNEEIVLLSEKILYKSVSCRLRRFHPELSLIELATTNAAGDRRELFSNMVIESGFGNKCSSEDIAKYLRLKIPARVDDPAMLPGRPFPYSVPPPILMPPQPATMLGTPPSMAQVLPQSSVNARLNKYKRDAALNVTGSGLYSQVNSPPTQLADRKQYTVTDGRTCTTAPTLPVKSTHNAYISHIEDGPFNFTVQLKSSVEDLLPKLRNILVRYAPEIPKCQNAPITAQLIPGSVVMAKAGDETLRRGVIMNVQPGSCKVYYIDYGNFEELSYSDIFQLPNTAAELSPAMAMQFCLADIKSMKITASNKDYFARLLLGKQVLIRVTERESNSPFQYCDILWEGRSVREILLNLNSPMQYSYQYPPRGREVPVSVIYVDGPSQFFVQYRSELSVVNQIQEALASYCPSQPRVTDLASINIGSPVASIFPDDQKWYRALIMGMDSSNMNVFYVDYGNRAEVTPSQICLLSRDLVNKWKTQAIECCLIGFDTVTPDLYMAEKMEEAALGHSYTLRLHSILSGFRLSVDLLDEQGNSVATHMKNLLNERQKAITVPSTLVEKKKPQISQDDDKSSQHSSDSGGKRNKYQRPGTRGDRGNKLEQRGERKFDERNKFDERPNSYSQHDDRSGNDHKTKDVRSDWKKGAKKPYMDQEDEWDGSSQEPQSNKKESWRDKQDSGVGFKKPEWKNEEQLGSDPSIRGSRPDRGDRQGGGFRSDSDRKGGSNRFERKPFNNDETIKNWDRGDSRGPRDRKFGDRENKFGDRENKFGDRETRFGDRENKFGDRENKFGNRENNRFGGRDNKFGGRDNRKPHWNENDATQNTAVAPEDLWDADEALVKKPSVVISEYPHQEIRVGQEYQVLFAVMETSPRDVYVQLADCDAKLLEIRNLINCDSTAAARPISNVVLAMPVLARFQDDGLLYRATIKSISKVPTGLVDVLFVDFGNTAVNPLTEVFTISSELMAIPIQAIHVIVSEMPTTPFPNLSACQAYFEAEHLILKPSRTTTVNLEQVVEGSLIRPDGQSVADCVKNDPLCLEEQLIDESNMQLTSSAVLEAQAPAPDTEIAVHTPMVLWREQLALLLGQRLLAKVVKKLNGDNVYTIKITAVVDLIVPAQSVDPLSRELTRGDDVTVAVDSLAENRLLVKYYDQHGLSLGKGSDIGAIIPMQIVQRRGIYTVSHREASTLFLQPADSTTLDNLLERLFEKYESSAASTDAFNVGDACAAKSSDENWYRAKITATVENTYSVFYLDYGNNENVERDNLRVLDGEFCSPEMCVSIVLPVTYKDVEGCMESLGVGPFECTFIKFDSDNGVWIADLCSTGKPKDNLALKWIEAGKADTMSDVSADPNRREPWWNLKKGDRVPIIVSHIESPDMFFAHRFEQSNYVVALQDEIQDLPDNGDLGDVFIAKYTQDSVWYRAVRFGDQVRFIDYGNLDPSVEMKNLPANFMHPVKGYAIPLRLCVKASGETWAEESAKIFDDFIEKSGLVAEIISVDFETIVDLRSGDESLSNILINGGHAVKFIPSLNNCELQGGVLEDALPVGKVPAVVTSLTSVNDFYIQENTKMAVLDLLASMLESADTFEILENPSLGQNVVAKFVDDSIWYRAKVICQDPLEVLFLDYGNISPAAEFRVLPHELASFPCLSWHCSLNIEDTPANNDLFSSLIDADSNFEFSFAGLKDDLHVVQLWLDNRTPFESSAVSDSRPSEIPIPAIEQKTVAQAKPISPVLTKPLYKDCILCHSNGPYDFYVQTDDDHIQIEEMANALFEAGSFPKIDSVRKGDFVVAQFTEDDAYYRAVVTDIEPEVVVHFIDYGNSCPASCFHELPVPLKEIPQLAIRCSLQSPIGGWSVDAIDKFTTVLNPETKSIVKIVSRGDPTIVDVEINGSSITKLLAPDAKFEPDPIPDAPSAENNEGVHLLSSGLCYIVSATTKECYIHDSSSSADLDVITEQLASIDISDGNSELKDAKVGDLVGAVHEEALYRGCVTKLDPPEVYFIDYGNTSPVSKFFKLPDPIKSQKPLAIKVKLDLGEGVELNDEGVTELQNLAADGANYTQTKPSVVELDIGGSKLTDMLKPYLVINGVSNSEASTVGPASTNQELTPITITHVNSISDFFYQHDLAKVNEMSVHLTDTEGFLPVEKCDIGQVVCGKYAEDELWYRGKILTTEPSITVLFVDYGNTSEVKEMKQLPAHLEEVPPLCVRASLKTAEQPWTEEDSDKFLEIAYGSADFTCSVIEKLEDNVIIELMSSEVGDVTSYLGRSCSVVSDIEYHPEVLSVDDFVPEAQCDEPPVVDNASVRPDLVVEPEMETSLKPETENSSLSSLQRPIPSPLIRLEGDIAVPVTDFALAGCSAPDTSIQNLELGSTDMLTKLTENLKTSPERSVSEIGNDEAMGNSISSKGDSSEHVMDELKVNTENPKDEHMVQESAQLLPESESKLLENVETLTIPCSSDCITVANTESESLVDDQDVDASRQLNSMSRAVMIMSAQASLTPFLAENLIVPVEKIGEAAPQSLDSISTSELQVPQESEQSLVNEHLPTDDPPVTLPEMPVPLVKDESQSVPESSSFFRLPNLKGTLLSVMGYDTSVSSESQQSTTSASSDVIIPSESETNDGGNQPEMVNSSAVVNSSTTLDLISGCESPVPYESQEQTICVTSDIVITPESETTGGILEASTNLDRTSGTECSVTSKIQEPSGVCNPTQSENETEIMNLSTVVNAPTALDHISVHGSSMSTNKNQTHTGLTSDTFIAPDSEVIDENRQSESTDSSTGVKAPTKLYCTSDDAGLVSSEILEPAETSIPSEFDESSKVVNLSQDPTSNVTSDTISGRISPLREFYEVLEDESHSCGLHRENVVPCSSDPVEELDADRFSSVGRPVVAMEQVTSSCIEPETNTNETSVFSNAPTGDEGKLVELVNNELNSYSEQHGTSEIPATAEHIDNSLDGSASSQEPTISQPASVTATLTEDPSTLTDNFQDCKTESNVADSLVGVDPSISDDTKILTKAEGVQTSTVSKKQETTSVKPAPKPSSTTIGTRKKTPVKTLAEIKASAKPRISTGRPTSSNLKNKPSPSQSGVSSSTRPQPTTTSCVKDRLIPGTVNGRIV